MMKIWEATFICLQHLSRLFLEQACEFCDPCPSNAVGCAPYATRRVGEVSQLYSYHQEAYYRGKGCSMTQLHNLTGGESRGPGPLKVVATQLTRHIHHFADKVEPGNAPGFHCL